MFTLIQTQAMNCKCKVDSWFKRVFKEQAGGAELIATIVIIGIVLVLAFTFRKNISNLVSNLWGSMTDTSKGADDIVPVWEP